MPVFRVPDRLLNDAPSLHHDISSNDILARVAVLLFMGIGRKVFL